MEYLIWLFIVDKNIRMRRGITPDCGMDIIADDKREISAIDGHIFYLSVNSTQQNRVFNDLFRAFNFDFPTVNIRRKLH